MLVIKRNDGLYYGGTNDFYPQLRKAKIYVSEKMIRNVISLLELRNPPVWTYSIVQVELHEVRVIK